VSIRIGSLSTAPARTAFTRWCRFNLVGVIGMAFQLAWVAALGRLLPARPLLVTATALELTLLHNFLWHQRYTWRGRGVELRPFQTVTRLLRFHLSNGAVSFAGNLLLVRLLMAHTRLPLILATAVAIVFCSLVNFLLGERWVFAAASPRDSSPVIEASASSPSPARGCG
jgi:putative flippase GtrA